MRPKYSCCFFLTVPLQLLKHLVFENTELTFPSNSCAASFAGLSKAETQALTNYGSGEDENEEEEIEEFEAGPVDVQTSLQASADGQVEQEVRAAVGHRNSFSIKHHVFV